MWPYTPQSNLFPLLRLDIFVYDIFVIGYYYNSTLIRVTYIMYICYLVFFYDNSTLI